MDREFNDAARVEEQREVGNIKNDRQRSSLLGDIRMRTEAYLRDSAQMGRTFEETFNERVSARYTELLKEQGLRADFMPPGTRRNLEAEAKGHVQRAHQADLRNLKSGYEGGVRQRIDHTVKIDKLEDRAEKFASDRDTWMAQRGNIVEHIGQAGTPTERQRYENTLESLDRGWSTTIERNYDTSRDRGLTPEFSRSAHDLGPSR